jgi:long-chain-fatty-acid---luciferin-component ligase
MLENCIKKYIPPQEKWTPADEALFKPRDLFRIPLKQAKEIQLKAMRFSFKHHYENNRFYNGFCKENNVSPNLIKSYDDLSKIPLIPDGFFKDYPNGKDFATWLGNIYTGELPEIVIKQANPNYDQVIESFNKSDILVTFSSGTSGRHTFIPRDERTFGNSEYALAKSLVTMIYPHYSNDMNGYLMMPNPKKTNIYAGKVVEVLFYAVKDVQVAIDREVTTELISMTMGPRRGIKSRIIRFFSRGTMSKIVDEMIFWLEKNYEAGEKIAITGAPYILYFVMEKLKKQGSKFDFGERGVIATGGGWKIHENVRLSVEDFRKEVEEVLGIPEHCCIDIYGMVEGNGWAVHCPEGHYLHVPYSFYKPIVLDEEFEQVGYGETGRYAFLDSTTYSYPGFITTGDKVRLLEHCPVCDRPGPVLEPEIKRDQGSEVRGCAEEMRSMMSRDLGR